jgi:hypothetical protein
MVSWRKRLTAKVWVATVAVSALLYLLQLQVAFVNHGQEFGAYGQYNRVLRMVRGITDYTIVSHRVRRKLELAHIFHVEDFSLTIRDTSGRTAEIFFEKGTADMQQKEDAALRDIVRSKFEKANADLDRRPRS